MIANLAAFRAQTDKICDYIPVVSSATNLIDLFQKAVFIPQMNPNEIKQNQYYDVMNNKSVWRCLCLLLFPGLSNLVVAISDYCKLKEIDHDFIRSKQIITLKQNGLCLKDYSLQDRSDKEIVHIAVQQNGMALEYASDELKNDREIVLVALRQNTYALDYASDELHNNRGIILAAVQHFDWAKEYFKDELKANPEVNLTSLQRQFALDTVKEDGLALEYANEELKNDPEVLLISNSIE
jgi:tetratricopeptide (TPR) repeat protein